LFEYGDLQVWVQIWYGEMVMIDGCDDELLD
jgi:hypothetical protein